MAEYESDGKISSRAWDYGGMPQGEYAVDAPSRRELYKALVTMVTDNLDFKDPKSMRLLYGLRDYLDGQLDALENVYGRDGKYNGEPITYEGKEETPAYGQKGGLLHGCPDCKCIMNGKIGGLESKLQSKPKGKYFKHDN